jgi:hypothetical protein
MQSMKKQRTPAQLPSDSWVSHWQVTRAIAEAFFPDRREASGVPLITHKALKSGPGEGLPYQLTQVDRAVLAKHADRFPSLVVTSSDSDWGEFLQTFAQLEPDLNWVPGRPSEADLYAEYCEGKAMADNHLQSLGSLLADGKIRAINDQRVPVSAIAADTLIARADLEKYLANCQISFTVARTAPRPMLGVNPPDLQLQPVNRATEQVTHAVEPTAQVELELRPLVAAAPPSDEISADESSVKKKKGRYDERFTYDELEFFTYRQKRGEPWSKIAAELVLSEKGLQRHMTRHRKRKEEEPSGATSAGVFEKMTETVARKSKP